MKNLIAIDPGASGGIAWNNAPGYNAHKMPDGMTNLAYFIRGFADLNGGESFVYMEDVGGYMPGNAGPGAVTFAKHIGHLEAICYMLALPVVKVRPQVWMKDLGFSVSKYYPDGYSKLDKAKKSKALAEAKRRNKNDIKEAMARLYPAIKVTLATADALAILTWAMKQEGV